MAGMLSRLFRRGAPEQRAVQSFYGAGGYSISSTGAAITPTAAENLSTVLACVNAVATGLATLPACVYRAEGDGRVEAPNHPVSRLIRSPNRHQSWPDWLEFSVAQTLLYGNSLSVVESDGAGRPTALIPVPWPNVLVSLLPSGRLAYDIVMYQTPWGGTGQTRRFLDDQVFHLRDRSDDGLVGRSRISRAPDVLNASIGLQTFASSLWNNAATFSGMVEVAPNISPDGLRRMQAWFEQTYTGAANAKRVFYGDSGCKFTPVSMSAEDAEVLESRRFSVIELARLFNVPPPLIQSYENNTFTNAATASIWFATNTLTPWARKIEAEFARSVFADPSGDFHIEIDLSGLMRGDYASRWTANVAAVNAGILTADEIRAQEGYGPLPKEAEPLPAAVAPTVAEPDPDPAEHEPDPADPADAASGDTP
jgi:HK97 family phage portal protein